MPAVICIVIGIIVLAACCGKAKSGQARKTGSREKVLRVDHPHYYSPDESECPVCGARFSRQSMACPRCGARFDGAEEDDTEFIEEMMEEEDWDEE